MSPISTDTAMLRPSAKLYGVEPEALVDSQPEVDLLRPEDVATTIVRCCDADSGVPNGAVLPGRSPRF